VASLTRIFVRRTAPSPPASPRQELLKRAAPPPPPRRAKVGGSTPVYVAGLSLHADRDCGERRPRPRAPRRQPHHRVGPPTDSIPSSHAHHRAVVGCRSCPTCRTRGWRRRDRRAVERLREAGWSRATNITAAVREAARRHRMVHRPTGGTDRGRASGPTRRSSSRCSSRWRCRAGGGRYPPPPAHDRPSPQPAGAAARPSPSENAQPEHVDPPAGPSVQAARKNARFDPPGRLLGDVDDGGAGHSPWARSASASSAARTGSRRSFVRMGISRPTPATPHRRRACWR